MKNVIYRRVYIHWPQQKQVTRFSLGQVSLSFCLALSTAAFGGMAAVAFRRFFALKRSPNFWDPKDGVRHWTLLFRTLFSCEWMTFASFSLSWIWIDYCHLSMWCCSIGAASFDGAKTNEPKGFETHDLRHDGTRPDMLGLTEFMTS